MNGDLDLETTDYDEPADPPDLELEEDEFKAPKDLEDKQLSPEFKMALDKTKAEDNAPIPSQVPQATPDIPQMGAQPMAPAPQAAPVNPGLLIDQITNPQVQELNQQDLSWAQDLRNRHIQPKTYKDLFNDASTPGKLGLAFGVLLSGIGSGLTHQPNAALEMMDKIIDRDFQAQKMSKENANNFLRTEYDHQMQEAQRKLVEAQAAGVPISNKEVLARIKDIEADVGLKSQTGAMNKVRISAMQDLQNVIDNLPPGQTQQQGQNFLDNVVAPRWTEQIQRDNAQTAAQLQSRGLLRNAQQDRQAAQMSPGAAEEERFTAEQTRMRLAGMSDIAADRESRHIPELGESSIPLSGGDREKINTGISFQNQLQGFINWSRAHSGDLNPADMNEGKALAAQLQAAYREATNGGVYKEGEQHFIGKLISDDPTKFFNEIRSIPQLRGIQRESEAQLKQVLRSKGFKKAPTYRPTWEQPKEKTKAASAPTATGPQPDGTKGTANGIPFTWKNGKRIRD